MYEPNIRTPAKTERKNIIIYYIYIGAIIQYITYIYYSRERISEVRLGGNILYTCPINNYNMNTTINIYIYIYYIGSMCVGCDLRIIFMFRVLIILMTAVSPPTHFWSSPQTNAHATGYYRSQHTRL